MNESTPLHEFAAFPKMARLSRECVVTEKIDGTNAQISIFPLIDGTALGEVPVLSGSVGMNRFITGVTNGFVVMVGSRNRWITPESDNYGFAGWVLRNLDEIVTLGEGRHFGEWWGNGIQRGYGLQEKRLSLFNVRRWCLHGEIGFNHKADGSTVQKDNLPPCVGLVPVLYRGPFCTGLINAVVESLRGGGSHAAPGFPNPEGVIVHHVAAGVSFKKTCINDDKAKGQL